MDISVNAARKFYEKHPDRLGFASRARLLQNTYIIEKKLQGKGALLDLQYGRDTGKNFLTEKIFELVKKEISNRDEKGRVIIPSRIWQNLLSSQPLAFNLFGELVDNPELAKRVFQDLFPNHKIRKIFEIKFEHSPGRNNIKYTGDRSAFDVFVRYENELNENCFFGIEVKYSESLNDKQSVHKDRYDEISKDAGIFKPEKRLALREKPIQQIWRDHLLALSMFISNDDYHRGDFIYLYPSENNKCQEAIKKYQTTFKPEMDPYFKPLTLEAIVATLKKHCKDVWVRDFEDRYLGFDKLIPPK